MGSDPSCALVLLIFADHGLDEPQRAAIIADVASQLTKTLHPKDWISPPAQRPLAATANGLIRVTEVLFTTDRAPATLSECADALREPAMGALQQQHKVELVLQPAELYQAHKLPGLAVFDMDSTLIQQEVIDELARAVGVYDQVATITEAAMRGEPPYTDFEASLRARVALLKGVPTSVWPMLRRDVITFTPGVRETTRVLKNLGWKLAVLSGGFTPLADWVKDTLELDYAHANHLVADETTAMLTGELVPGAPIVHAQRKQELLRAIGTENGIPRERTIAVGDGSNDLLMMAAAGMGVAFNAKPKVQQAAPVRLNSGSMLDLLHILGYTSVEIQSLLGSQLV